MSFRAIDPLQSGLQPYLSGAIIQILAQHAGRMDLDIMSDQREGYPYAPILGIDHAVRCLSTYSLRFSGASRFLLKNDRF